MNKKCLGCGILLQTIKENELGFVPNIENDFCDRCYQLKHFNKKFKTHLDAIEYFKIINKEIKKFKTIILVVDCFNLTASINESLLNILKNKKVILLINKVDLLPKSYKLHKMQDLINEIIPLQIEKTFFISAEKKYNIDALVDYLNKTKINKIPLIGMANVGKSSLVNTIIKSKNPKTKNLIIVSPYSGTTLDCIEKELENITIIDTPGLINEKNIINYLDKKSIKKLTPKKEIKPTTFQLNDDNSLFITSLLQIDFLQGMKTSFTIYCSNEIKIHRTKTEKTEELRDKFLYTKLFTLPEEKMNFKFINKKIKIPKEKMLFVSGIGFITFNNKKTIEIGITIPDILEYKVVDTIFKERK